MGPYRRAQERERAAPLPTKQAKRAEAPGDAIIAGAAPVDDRALVERIVRAYQEAIEHDPDSRASEWTAVEDNKKLVIHDALMSTDIAAVQAILRDPGRSDLLYGFDNLCATFAVAAAESKDGLATQAEELIIRLAQAIGAYRHPNKNVLVGAAYCSQTSRSLPGLEETLEALDDALAIRIDFPNPFPGELGAETSRGIASYRAIQALYQAWRISQLCRGITSPRIVEIGAGLGRTVYYAWRMGLRDLTIVDIAMSGVAQAYFLGRMLGGDSVRLYGEERKSGIHILPPSAFLDANNRYDLLINIDSWTEMPKETARQYMQAALARCAMIWSVNHEASRFTVRDLFAEFRGTPVTRSPYWMRDGYVDEFLGMGIVHEMSAVPAQKPIGASTIGRARRRLEQFKRAIVRWKPINNLIAKLR